MSCLHTMFLGLSAGVWQFRLAIECYLMWLLLLFICIIILITMNTWTKLRGSDEFTE